MRTLLVLWGLLLAPVANAQPVHDIDPEAVQATKEQLGVDEMLARAHDLIDDQSRPYRDRWLEALNLVVQALAWEPERPEIYIELARITVRLGGYSAASMNTAEAHLRHALKLDPENSFAYVLLGWVGIHRQDYAFAEENLAIADRMGSDSEWLDYNWAVLLSRTNRMEQALDHYWALVDPPHSNQLAVELSVSKLLNHYMNIEDWASVESLIDQWDNYEDDKDEVNTLRAEVRWKAERDLDGALHYALLAHRGGFGNNDRWFSSFLSGLLALSATRHFEGGDTETAWEEFAQAERLANLGDLMVAAAANKVTSTGLAAAPGSSKDEINVVYAMVEYGIPVNARSDGYGSYALHVRTAMNDKVNVDRLLALGADPNLRDSSGMNALHIAVLARAEGVIQSLLSFGVNPQAAIVPAPGAQLPEHLRGEKTPLSIAERQGDPASMRIGHIIADYMGVSFPSWATRNLALMDWEQLKPLLFIGMDMPDGSALARPEKSAVLEDRPGEKLVLEAPFRQGAKRRAAVYLHDPDPPTREELQVIADTLKLRGFETVSLWTFTELADVGRLNAQLSDYRSGFGMSVYAGDDALQFFNQRNSSRTGQGDYYVDWEGTKAEERGRQIEATQVQTANLLDLPWAQLRPLLIATINAHNIPVVDEEPSKHIRLRSVRVTDAGERIKEYFVLIRPDPLDYDELDQLVQDARNRRVGQLVVAVTAEISETARELVHDQMKQLPVVSLIDKTAMERNLSARRDTSYVIDWESAPAEPTGGNLVQADWATISNLILEFSIKKQRWAAPPSQIREVANRPYDVIVWEISNESWFPPMPRRVVFVWRREPLDANEFLGLIDEFEAESRVTLSPISGYSKDIENTLDARKIMKYIGPNPHEALHAAASAGIEYYVDWQAEPGGAR